MISTHTQRGKLPRFLMLLVGAAPAVVFADPAAQREVGAGLMMFALLSAAMLGLGVSVTYWLTFFPTPAYVRFVTRAGQTVPEPAGVR